MNYFEAVNDLPCFELETDLYSLISNKILYWPGNWQICMNATKENSDNFLEGTGSLYFDWDKKTLTKDENGNEKIFVPEREPKLEENDFKYLCTQFQGTKFETIYNSLQEKYKIGRVRLMLMKPKTCLSWHVDSSKRLHYPVKTQKGCFMNISGETKEMPQYKWCLADTTVEHTAVNASKEDRIHLVVTVLSENN